MMYRHFAHRFIALLVASLWVAGCSKAPQQSEEAQTSRPPEPARQFITVGTAPPGGAFFMVGNAVADVVNMYKGDLNWVISTESTQGTQENIRRLEAGEIQFGMANAAISYFAARGEGDWETAQGVRVVATLAPNVGIFIATKGSGVRSLADLKGKRVVLGPSGAGFHYFLKPLLAAHGIRYEDITELNEDYTASVDLLADGKADAAFMGGAIPIPAVTQACASQDIVFLPFEDGVEAKLKDYPFYSTMTVKAGTYSDLETDLTGINVGNMHLVTHSNVSDDVVYTFLKVLYEHREDLAQQHPAGKALNPENAIRDTGTLFHPGAIRYYKEAGVWPQSDNQ